MVSSIELMSHSNTRFSLLYGLFVLNVVCCYSMDLLSILLFLFVILSEPLLEDNTLMSVCCFDYHLTLEAELPSLSCKQAHGRADYEIVYLLSGGCMSFFRHPGHISNITVIYYLLLMLYYTPVSLSPYMLLW